MKRSIKQVSRWLLGRQRTSTLFGVVRKVTGSWSATNVLNAELKKLHADPVNPQLHGKFAEYLAHCGRTMAAFAEYRTAKQLGWNDATVDSRIRELYRRLPAVETMNHNRYYRLKTLADAIVNVAEGQPVSILDVGGGDGALAQFVPLDFGYCLAEPKTNRISGEHLPFHERSFDIVASCHVLEHVPQAERSLFLDTLVSNARLAVVLLNPFDNEAADMGQQMKLVWDLTHAPWVKEHMDCGLPVEGDLRDYASHRGLQIEIKPNGSMPTSMAIVLMEYFAKKANRTEDLKRVYGYLNSLPERAFDFEPFPNALIVTLRRSGDLPKANQQ